MRGLATSTEPGLGQFTILITTARKRGIPQCMTSNIERLNPISPKPTELERTARDDCCQMPPQMSLQASAALCSDLETPSAPLIRRRRQRPCPPAPMPYAPAPQTPVQPESGTREPQANQKTSEHAGAPQRCGAGRAPGASASVPPRRACLAAVRLRLSRRRDSAAREACACEPRLKRSSGALHVCPPLARDVLAPPSAAAPPRPPFTARHRARASGTAAAPL